MTQELAIQGEGLVPSRGHSWRRVGHHTRAALDSGKRGERTQHYLAKRDTSQRESTERDRVVRFVARHLARSVVDLKLATPLPSGRRTQQNRSTHKKRAARARVRACARARARTRKEGRRQTNHVLADGRPAVGRRDSSAESSRAQLLTSPIDAIHKHTRVQRHEIDSRLPHLHTFERSPFLSTIGS